MVQPAQDLPAWALASTHLRIDKTISLGELDHEWAFGGATGAGVRVAVVDSGIDAYHPDLGGCVDLDGGVEVLVQPDESVEISHGPHQDSFGHGTACAGIIHSLAPEAQITSVKVLGAGLRGKMAGFFAGLEWAVEQGFDVINLSLGGAKRDWALPFHELCDEAYFKGSFIVTAANNVQRQSYPSLYSSVTSVACNLSDDPWRFHYNPDPPTEFLARGIDVPVLWNDGDSQVATGNSYAAPHIAAMAALIASKHGPLRPFQIKTILWAVAANVTEARENQVAGRMTRMSAMRPAASRIAPRRSVVADPAAAAPEKAPEDAPETKQQPDPGAAPPTASETRPGPPIAADSPLDDLGFGEKVENPR